MFMQTQVHLLCRALDELDCFGLLVVK